MGRPYFALMVVGAAANYDFVKQKIDFFIGQIRDKYDFIIIPDGTGDSDSFAEKYAEENGFQLKVMPKAKSSTSGKAGYIQAYDVHLHTAGYEHRGCIAFWDGHSYQTLHSQKMAACFKTPFRLVKCS